MRSLISINHNFMSISPKDLVNLIKESKYTKGVEIYIDSNNSFELKYLDDLVFELKRYDLILEVHGEINLDFDKQIEFMKILEGYADYLDMKINVTFHTIYDEVDSVSLEKTVDYLSKLISNISDKLIICLENMNDMKGYNRLGKEDIRKTILNDEKIYFTYDIGHEISDYGRITDLDEYMIDVIRNVHIHSFDSMGIDHMPIYKNDPHWNEIIKGLTFLKVNKYSYNVVFEYGLDYCMGSTIEEKIKDYLSSIDYVSERFVD